MDTTPIAIPATATPPRRPPVPIMAAVVPIAAGIVLWLITDSLFALCFAAMGPLMIAASLLDGMRAQRRERKRLVVETDEGWVIAEAELKARHEAERRQLWNLHPDVAESVLQPPLQGGDVFDETTRIVAGRGAGASSVRTAPGEGERAKAFSERARSLADVPTTVPLGRGVCVRASPPVAVAVVRALVVQLCLRYGPAQLAIVGNDLADWGLDVLPHAGKPRRNAFQLGVITAGQGRAEGAAQIWVADPSADIPDGVTTVIDCAEPLHARLRTPQGVQALVAEALSFEQAVAIASTCAERADDVDALPDSVALHELAPAASGVGLAATIGRGESGDIVLDIVEDGPHAIVTGVTGTGKSELLVTWITAIAQHHGPDEVSFVLADFKGGTAFDPLRELPQVAAVITDLDEEGARRGVSSLTAELRRREGILAAAGARDIGEAAVGLPRLIIVVDEFAALLQDYPDLGAVFTDVAARGRALGMHLILGTQRAAGVIREALAANCPLRVSLRVTNPEDSRLVIGTDAASEIPGGPLARGLAIVRRPQDSEPRPVRVALTAAADLRAIALRWQGSAITVSPWLPTLPARLTLNTLRSHQQINIDGELILGLADVPERQAQPLETIRVGRDRGLAIMGGSGAGKTTALQLLAEQYPDHLWIPQDPEAAWDAVSAVVAGRAPQSLLLCDNLDLLLAGYPPEYAQEMAQSWEQIIRSGVARTVVVASARASGPIARLIDGMQHRALLRMASRVEHLAAGGESSGFLRDRIPGRARIGEREVQLALPRDPSAVGAFATDTPAAGSVSGHANELWQPRVLLTGVVTGNAAATAPLLRAAYPECEVVVIGTEPADADRPVIVVGEGESWQRQWSLWQRIRHEGEMLVRAECQSELRQIAGVRELPPFARPHAGRVWALRGGEQPIRVVIPALGPRHHG